MTDCQASPDALAESAQVAAEAHLHACWEALHAEEDGNESPSWPPTAAPFCGCDKCVIRETLTAAWPLLVEAALAEVALDIQRVALRPGDTVIVNSDRHVTLEQAERIKARVREAFPDHQALVLSGGLALSVVGIESEDETPVPATTE